MLLKTKNTNISIFIVVLKIGEFSLVWFKVPVDNAIVVQILQSQHRLCKVHPGHVHRQRTHVLQKGGTVSPCKDQWTEVTDVLEIRVYCFQ